MAAIVVQFNTDDFRNLNRHPRGCFAQAVCGSCSATAYRIGQRRLKVMKNELLMTAGRVLKRGLAALCLALLAGPANALAQEAGNYCEPAAAVKDELKQVPRWADDELSYRRYRQRLMAALEDLARKYPRDFHVRKRLLDARLGDNEADREALADQYRALMEKDPADPAATYFYAKTLLPRH